MCCSEQEDIDAPPPSSLLSFNGPRPPSLILSVVAGGGAPSLRSVADEVPSLSDVAVDAVSRPGPPEATIEGLAREAM